MADDESQDFQDDDGEDGNLVAIVISAVVGSLIVLGLFLFILYLWADGKNICDKLLKNSNYIKQTLPGAGQQINTTLTLNECNNAGSSATMSRSQLEHNPLKSSKQSEISRVTNSISGLKKKAEISNRVRRKTVTNKDALDHPRKMSSYNPRYSITSDVSSKRSIQLVNDEPDLEEETTKHHLAPRRRKQTGLLASLIEEDKPPSNNNSSFMTHSIVGRLKRTFGYTLERKDENNLRMERKQTEPDTIEI